MNEITITGSTGVIGRRAVREVLAAGYRVTGVTRSSVGRERLEQLGARAVDADVFDDASLRRAFDGADAVINLLTHVPRADRMADPSAWNENDRMRTEASAAIARAATAGESSGSCRSRSRSCTPTEATRGSTRPRRWRAAA
jgi:UDP-glucose 4-epimerase